MPPIPLSATGRSTTRIRSKAKQGRRRRRHWKLKMWKRRTAMRTTKAKEARLAALEP